MIASNYVRFLFFEDIVMGCSSVMLFRKFVFACIVDPHCLWIPDWGICLLANSCWYPPKTDTQGAFAGI